MKKLLAIAFTMAVVLAGLASTGASAQPGDPLTLVDTLGTATPTTTFDFAGTAGWALRRQLRSSRSYLRASAPHDRSLTSLSRTISLSRSRFFEVVRPFGLPGFLAASFHDARGAGGFLPSWTITPG
jgi:hypothetical protein